MRPVSEAAAPLPVRHLSQVDPQPANEKWLVESLWLSAGVGILGGAPKVCKTFLAAELSVAVASGHSALGRFATPASGPVLFFGAEDSPPALRNRFEGLLAAKGLRATELPLYLIDVPALRLDRGPDLARLRAAVEQLRPRLLVLDPFVRIAAIDENSAAEVSAVLASLRALQRDHDLAVLVVHHARKSPAAHPAQALRGSSDFAAWSDTNLCLSRHGKHLALFIEHRNAPAPEPLTLRLVTDPTPHLLVVDNASEKPPSNQADDLLPAQLLEQLHSAAQPVTTVRLRDRLGRRKADVIRALDQLRLRGCVQRTSSGWIPADPPARP
jgi:hypothetical protein